MMKEKNIVEKNSGEIIKVAGPLVVAQNLEEPKLGDICRVGSFNLIAEIVKIEGNKSFLQVYEDTSGLAPGDKVINEKKPLSVELGPGLLGNIFDGILRPLAEIAEKEGIYIGRGIEVPSLNREKLWNFEPVVKEGSFVEAGDILGYVAETEFLKHAVMVPPDIKKGKVKKILKGQYRVAEEIALLENEDGFEFPVKMFQVWPVRRPRPVKEKLVPKKPLVTGQRIIDSFFPVVKGGTASVPGPFGSGKTVVQHQLAKWADADIIIFVGCGERGNEMTDVLKEFPHLKDPKTGRPLLERTVLIANTSNMPVAAREASIYTGITLAEYFRDMGYDVALMADSTSRWAEALREMGSRLEEMPGEEGYPAYLGSRIAAFYERAGLVKCLGSPEREGSLTVIGAVSPPGGDLSEPVTQNTLRVSKVFWALDDKLAAKRHFPAINWLKSYTLYNDVISEYFSKNISPQYPEVIKKALALLSQEEKLLEILRLVGFESLSDQERLILETAEFIREDFLMQNAFDEADSYTSLKKQFQMLSLIIKYYQEREKKIAQGISFADCLNPEIKEFIKKMRFLAEKDLAQFDEIEKRFFK
jgi:V/A-type H+-transporting ATPase subunit A